MFHRFSSRVNDTKKLIDTGDKQIILCKPDFIDQIMKYTYIAPGYKFIHQDPHIIKVEEKISTEDIPFVGKLCMFTGNNSAIEIEVNQKKYVITLRKNIYEYILFEIGCDVTIPANNYVSIFSVYGVIDVLNKCSNYRQLKKSQVHNLYCSMIWHNNKRRSDVQHLMYLKDPVLDTLIELIDTSDNTTNTIYITYTHDGITTQQEISFDKLINYIIPNGSSDIVISKFGSETVYEKIKARLIKLRDVPIKYADPTGIDEVLNGLLIYEFPVFIFLENFYGPVCDVYTDEFEYYDNSLRSGIITSVENLVKIKDTDVKKKTSIEDEDIGTKKKTSIEDEDIGTKKKLIIEDEDDYILKVLSAEIKEYDSNDGPRQRKVYECNDSIEKIKESDRKLYELLKLKYDIKYSAVAKIPNAVRRSTPEKYYKYFTYKDGQLIPTDVKYHPHVVEFYTGGHYAKHVASAFAIYPKK